MNGRVYKITLLDIPKSCINKNFYEMEYKLIDVY